MGGRSALSISDDVAPDAEWYGAAPTVIRELRGPAAEAVIGRLPAAAASYPYATRYSAWPGPNSNTFVAHLGREVPELRLAMPSIAIGKDYLPEALAREGTQRYRQLSLFGVVGVCGAREGLEVNLFGLVTDRPAPSSLKFPGVSRTRRSLTGPAVSPSRAPAKAFAAMAQSRHGRQRLGFARRGCTRARAMSRDLIEAGLGWEYRTDRIGHYIGDPDAVVRRPHRHLLGGFAVMRLARRARTSFCWPSRRRRRRGIAMRMLTWLTESAQVAGVASLHVELRAGNVAARALYRAAGFGETLRIEGYYRGRETAVRMLRRLRAGLAS
jgi:hypothetical protein